MIGPSSVVQPKLESACKRLDQKIEDGLERLEDEYLEAAAAESQMIQRHTCGRQSFMSDND